MADLHRVVKELDEKLEEERTQKEREKKLLDTVKDITDDVTVTEDGEEVETIDFVLNEQRDLGPGITEQFTDSDAKYQVRKEIDPTDSKFYENKPQYEDKPMDWDSKPVPFEEKKDDKYVRRHDAFKQTK